MDTAAAQRKRTPPPPGPRKMKVVRRGRSLKLRTKLPKTGASLQSPVHRVARIEYPVCSREFSSQHITPLKIHLIILCSYGSCTSIINSHPGYCSSTSLKVVSKLFCCRLPLPGCLLTMFPEELDSQTEDSSLHGGRVRSFKHERGNWATYVYLPCKSIFSNSEILLSHKSANLTFRINPPPPFKIGHKGHCPNSHM